MRDVYSLALLFVGMSIALKIAAFLMFVSLCKC